MLNPIMYLAVFSLVFTVVLHSGIPDFPVFLLTGLLAWNLFSTSLTLSARSVVENANLVKKVAFPHEVLPLAAIGSAVFDFLLQTVVLVVFMVAATYPFFGTNLLLLPLSLIALLSFTGALSLFVASLNVRYRDIQHLLNVIMLAWFWLTPVVYQPYLLQCEFNKVGHWLYYGYLALNPMADIVAGFQRSVYRFVAPAGAQPNPCDQTRNVLFLTTEPTLALMLIGVIAGSLLLGYVTWKHFFRLSGDFAEEL
jgi:ABC-2 type transport system permease protein